MKSEYAGRRWSRGQPWRSPTPQRRRASARRVRYPPSCPAASHPERDQRGLGSPHRAAGGDRVVRRRHPQRRRVSEALRGGEAAARAFAAGVRDAKRAPGPRRGRAAQHLLRLLRRRRLLHRQWAMLGRFRGRGRVRHRGTLRSARPGVVSGRNRAAMGSFAASSFPGDDYAWVRTNADWTGKPAVNTYQGAAVAVRGSSEARIGARSAVPDRPPVGAAATSWPRTRRCATWKAW